VAIGLAIYEIEVGFRRTRKETGFVAETGCGERMQKRLGRLLGHTINVQIPGQGMQARAHAGHPVSSGRFSFGGTVFARQRAGPVKCLVDPRKTPWRSGRISQT